MIENIRAALNNPINALLLICFILIVVFLNITRKKRKKPPGPKGIPFIGNLFLFKPLAYKILNKLTMQYGPIYEFNFLGHPIIVLGNYETIKEALLKNGEIFSGRPKGFLYQWYSEDYHGIFFSSENHWKEQRRFALSTLRNFGFGKSSLEERIIQEAQFLINEINQKNGEPFDPQLFFYKCVSNVILSLTCNKRMDYNDEAYENMLENIDNIVNGSHMTSPVNFLPSLRFLFKSWYSFSKGVIEVKTFLQKIIKEHEEHHDANNNQDYIDVFLEKKYKMEKSDSKTTFTNLQLIISISDFFLAGTETTSTTLRWMLNPEIQKKVQNEIDSVIGPNRPPTIKDREKLPFTDATIMEIQRRANIVPLSVLHASLKDFNLLGFDIPKDSYIIPDLTAVHFDSAYWKDPHKFNPNRFLNDDGTIKTNMESFIPFSIGHRMCLGESLAKMEVFVFFVSLFQHFNFVTPPNDNLPPITACVEGIVLRPLNFKVCAIAR